MRQPSDPFEEYQWWRDALEGNFGPVHDGHPQCGFYRMRDGKDGPWVPVEIKLHQPLDENGELHGDEVKKCFVGSKGDRRERDVNAIWNWVAKYPVTYEQFHHAYRNGSWPDDPPEPKARPFMETLSPGMGHNQPDDPVEALRFELEGEEEIADSFLAEPVTTKEQADKIGPWAKRIGAIAKRADDARKVEKQPHLDAERAVDAKWNPMIDQAKNLVAKLKKHVEPFLLAQQEDERKRAAEAAKKAEKLRKQAEEVAKTGDEVGQAAAAELTRQANAAAAQSTPKNASAGRTGAKVALRTRKVARVNDYKAAAAALIDAKHAEIFEKIDQLAQRAVNNGFPLAGVEVVEESKAA